MPTFSAAITTSGNHFKISPLRPYGGSKHLTEAEALQVIAGIAGKDLGSLQGLTQPTSSASFPMHANTRLTIFREN